ncbi:Hypothetical protein NTJ_05587 [Nesidiocoris tenuis]|uniref:Uncharacterized protein n=1 Tax=Nesidiocoris tenuis TaxID=355587 RepID=A0ABN7ANA0_9HEMI|nr:Hypothetical protein NTJ_05586 [Nesidiocoris tenuis]BES92778.1 Hypothetical protein NTJ_05587 [Nesidiocoris tenuis]
MPMGLWGSVTRHITPPPKKFGETVRRCVGDGDAGRALRHAEAFGDVGHWWRFQAFEMSGSEVPWSSFKAWIAAFGDVGVTLQT